MSKNADTVTKKFVSQNEIFADIVNYYFFDGKQKIKPEDLNALNPVETTLIRNRLGKITGRERVRDILKSVIIKETDDVIYILVGVENQTDVHYAMPVRNLLYDAINYDWDHSFTVDFDLETGFSKKAETTKRYLSQMKDMYYDTDAAEKILKDNDPMIYEFYELGCPERAGDLAFGTTILYPGQVGGEYYMTKGHFHTQLDTSEVYYTLSGEGYMVMENPEGDTIEKPLVKGEAVYVPRRYAHRTVNTGKEPLVVFFTFAADAGHDYGTIETKGYHNMVVERDGKPVIVPNPKWQ